MITYNSECYDETAKSELTENHEEKAKSRLEKKELYRKVGD